MKLYKLQNLQQTLYGLLNFLDQKRTTLNQTSSFLLSWSTLIHGYQ